MISWTIATTGNVLTNHGSTRFEQIIDDSNTFDTSNTGLFFGTPSTYSRTSSLKYDRLQLGITETSGNETATFSTAIFSVTGSYTQNGGETIIVGTGPPLTGNDPGSSTESFVSSFTTSGLRTYASVSQQTSTTQTVSASKFGNLQSSSAYPASATARISSEIGATTTLQSSLTTLTTTTKPNTFWFYTSISTQKTEQHTTTINQTTSGVSFATVYQADGNAVIYKISNNPSSFVASPIAARSMGQTFTRITVSPILNTTQKQSTVITLSGFPLFGQGLATQSATTSETLTIQDNSTRTLTYLGPENSSTTFTHQFPITSTETVSVDADYQYLSSYLATSGLPAPGTGDGKTTYKTSAMLQGNKYEQPQWLPSLFAYMDAGTSQNRSGKAAWVIAGQFGSETTPTDLPIDLNAFSGSISRGKRTFYNITNSYVTLDLPSVTYTTENNGSNTTSSTIIGAEGATTEVIYDDLDSPAHIGGGSFAPDWTVIDRVQPDFVYANLVNSQTTSYLGNDTSRSGGQSASVSHLTLEPHLIGGGAGGSATPDAIFWTEARNSVTVFA
jgi:hypothetical protein